MADTPHSNPEQQDHQGCQTAPPVTPAQQSTQATPDKNAGPINWPTFRAVFFGITAIVTVAGLFYAGVHWVEQKIENTVEHKLSDPVILRKVAAESRPLLIFNGDESYVTDQGATQFIKELKFTDRNSTQPNATVPAHIHIEFTKFFSSAILTPLSENLCVATGKRGKGLSWDFEIKSTGISLQGAATNSADQLFRLELLP